MIRKLGIAAGIAALAASPSFAASCKEAKTGRFIKCPVATPAAKPITTKRCRNNKGQFAKCGTPGAKPA